MKIVFSFLLLIAANAPSVLHGKTEDINTIIALTLDNKEIEKTLSHYKNDSVFFHISSNIKYEGNKIEHKNILGEKTIIYRTHSKSPTKPVINFTVLEINNDSAKVTLGIPKEGLVGRFKLVKRNRWIIVDTNIYFI